MSERLRGDSTRYQHGYPTNTAKMSEGDLGTRKTVFVLVIVVGCFAVLWPKVFYPMLVGPSNERMRPNRFDKGCCDVISDIDVNTIKIMNELCNNIVQQNDEKVIKGQDIITTCRKVILNKCGIDISAVLQEQVRLGRSFKQIVDEVRSFNGSLCLKYNFGVSPWKLGAPHRVTLNPSPIYVKQERPAHLRPEMLHPALREKGRAIPQPYHPPAKGSQPRFVDGRPGPVPGIRPPMGAGHVVQPQKSSNSMGVIMPIYTVGIIIFFSYTLMKFLFKKKPEGPGGHLYPPVEPSMTFRRDVFEAAKIPRPSRDPGSRDQELDHLRRRLRETELAMERIVSQMAQVPLSSQKERTSNGSVVANGSTPQDHDQPSVKVLGMEMTASCEGGQKWSRPDSPVMPNTPPPPPEPADPPQEIYLEGSLPAQSQLLVADSKTQPEPDFAIADPAVVLASKMTLSVISLDSQESENENENAEKSKLRNGDYLIERETIEDDIIDESKYTTASGGTAAERDVSDGERTDDENDIEDIEKIPDFAVDNGAQHIDPELHSDIDFEFDSKESDMMLNEDSNRPQEQTKSNLRFKDDENLTGSVEQAEDFLHFGKENQEDSLRFSEEVLSDDCDPNATLSPEVIEDITDIIDDVINTGTRMTEIISAEREASTSQPETGSFDLEPENSTIPLDNSKTDFDSLLNQMLEVKPEGSNSSQELEKDDVNG